MNEERKIEVQEVDAVDAPPKARVETGGDAPAEASMGVAETFARKRDYLDGFLAQKPQANSPGEPGGAIHDGVIAALKEIYDPEIPVNIYELGLIYNVEVAADAHVVVTMTLTTPHCPVAESMPGEVEIRVGAVPGVGVVDVNLVWDPPWDPSKMSDEAKLELGML
ncbi:MAG: SUF system Fe-S cluster assembly protein [Sphingomonas sp.]